MKCYVVTRINFYERNNAFFNTDVAFTNCFPVRVFVGPEAKEKAEAFVREKPYSKDVTYQVDDCLAG